MGPTVQCTQGEKAVTTNANIALLWRGHAAEWAHRFHEARQWPIIEALQSLGASARPILYTDDAASSVRDELLAFDAVMVWVNPLDGSADRFTLDAVLRDVAGRGVVVSAHPDVIAKLGVKDVLYTTRSIEWGSDVARYTDAASFRASFPERLAAGPRVLKPNRGNGGQDIWRVELIGSGATLGSDILVDTLEARQGSRSARVALAAFVDRWASYLDDGGVLIDQAFQTRLSEGMVRCYMCGHLVVGFGHQLITALMTSAETDGGPPPQPGPRIMFDPDANRFRDLREAMESRWVPEMQRLLSIADHDLPLLWDADFLFRDTVEGENPYVLCEINASSVAPFPDSAIAPIAAAAIGRALARQASQTGQLTPDETN